MQLHIYLYLKYHRLHVQRHFAFTSLMLRKKLALSKNITFLISYLFQIIWGTSQCHWIQEKFQHKWHFRHRSHRTHSILTQSFSFRCTIIRGRHHVSIGGLFEVPFNMGGCWWYFSYNPITIPSGKDITVWRLQNFPVIHQILREIGNK